MKTKPQKGKGPLKPKARLIRTIGNELISNEVVAIIELVKNSYDADAQHVEIRFEGDIEKGKGKIILTDDGHGMTLDVIKKAWMEPATSFKKVKTKSKAGRKVLGEKGIGRFASAKLADKLTIITKSKDDNEVIANFDWISFEDNDKYLDEVECSWEVKEAQSIESQGTILILSELTNVWSKENIRQLYVGLSRLINPVKPINDFEITFTLPNKEEYNNLSGIVQPPVTLGKPDYSLSGNVSARGEIEATYTSKFTKKSETIKEKLQFKPQRKIICGKFNFEFRVWNREPEYLKQLAFESDSSLRDVKRDLNEAGGISIYRDEFRVFPYGEPKNDWLRLDFRRVQNPTKNLSNNQIVGYVSISLDSNPELRDQSNREGIIDSQSLIDFKESIIYLLNLLEIRRYKEKRKDEAIEETKNSLFAPIDISPVRQIIHKKFPQDKEVNEVIERVDSEIKRGIHKVQEVLTRYRRLSTLGQLLDVVIHDGNKLLYGFDSQLFVLDKEFKKDTIQESKINSSLDKLKNSAQSLSLLFKRLEPFGGRKRGKPKDFILEDAIKNVFEIHAGQLNKFNIVFSISDSQTLVKLDQSEFELMLVNLLQNSIYWLQEVNEDRKIVVLVTSDSDKLELIFSDSGPGVSIEDVPFIFNPYFSKKPDGIGLGLTSVGELMTEYSGSLELISNGPLKGASFRLVFRRRI